MPQPITDPAPNEESGDVEGNLPTVSAVIPAYNAADTIERALNSVYAQTYENIIEVIVVDDGSTDDTAAIIRDKFPDVKLIQQENQGNAGTRNTGVDAATGEYIAFLDADDEWLLDKTSTQVIAVSGRRGVALMTSRFYMVTVRGARFINGRQPMSPQTDLTFRDWFSLDAFRSFLPCCSGWLIRSAPLRTVGGFDARLRRAVDWEFVLRITANGYLTCALDEPLFVRHSQDESLSVGIQAEAKHSLQQIEVISRYDPAIVSATSGLVGKPSFDAALKRCLFGAAVRLCRAGEPGRAADLFRRSREMPGGRPMARLLGALAAISPSAATTLHLARSYVIGHFRVLRTRWRSGSRST